MKNKVLPPVFILLAIILIAVLHFFLPIKKIFIFPWNILGIIPLADGIVINLLADKEFKRYKTTVKPFEESTALITGGIFRITRNPMYLGLVLILLGIVMLLGTLSPYLVVVIFAYVMQKKFIAVEEKMLEEEFGEEWREYKQKVRQWI